MGTSISAIITVTTAAAGVAPSQATNLSVSNLTSNALTLVWSAPASGSLPFVYQPQQALQSANPVWSSVGSATTATTATITGLSPNTAYLYRILTSNPTGSSLSDPVSATTLSILPSAPTGLAVTGTPTQTSITVVWNAPASGTAPFTYQVSYRSPSGAGSFTNFASTTTATSQTITGLTAGTSYDLQVTASNAAGTSPASTVLSNVQTAGLPVNAPGPATGLTISSLSTTSLTLSWTAPTSGTTPFTYQPEQAPAGANPTWTNIGSGISSTSINVTGLTPNTAYQFLVATANTAGSSNSATVGATTLSVVPGVPTGLAVVGSPTQTSVTLQWVAPTTGTTPFTYQVSLRTPSGSGSYINFASTTTATTQTISGLTAGSSYDFEVTASNLAGPGSPSTPLVNVITAAASSAPGPATGLTISSLSTTSLVLSWTAPSTGTTPFSYQPQQALAGSSNWTNIGTSTSATSVTVSGLTANTSYQFLVLTSNVAGTSTSATVSSTTLSVLPSAPTGLVVVGSPTQTTVTLQWSAPAAGTQPITYQVSARTPSGSGSFTPAGASTSSLSTTISGLTAGVSYDFEVAASNVAGTGPESAVLSNVVTASQPAVIPSAPTNLTAGTITTTSIQVSWTSPSTGTPPLSYVVQYQI